MPSFKLSDQTKAIIAISAHYGLPFNELAELPDIIIYGYLDLMKQEYKAQERSRR